MDKTEFQQMRTRAAERFKQEKQRIKDEGGFKIDIPDGDYIAKIVECKFVTTKAGVDLAIVNLDVAYGPNKGSTITIMQQLTDQGMPFFSRLLGKLGINVPALEWEDVEREFLALQDQNIVCAMALARSKTDARYQDKFINRVLTPEEAIEYLEAPATPADTATKEDLPF